jgi:hypothetical protein
MGGSINAYV